MNANEAIRDGLNAVAQADDFGVVSLTIFFLVLFLGVVGFFIYYLLTRVVTVIDNNTRLNQALLDNIKSNGHAVDKFFNKSEITLEKLDRVSDKISQKQDNIYVDLQKIVARYNYINKEIG